VTNISVSAEKNIGIQSSTFKPGSMSETWHHFLVNKFTIYEHM